MWQVPMPLGPLLPDVPFVVSVPGLGVVLVLVAIAVTASLAWLIGLESRLTVRRLSCPIDRATCEVVTDRRGRIVACDPHPRIRGIRCDAGCLAA